MSARLRRTWLEIEEVRAVLDVEVMHRTLVATLILAGLRIGELIALTWRDVDLVRGKLKIEDAKTDAGQRNIDITPDLLDLLKVHKATSSFPGAAELVFPTSTGRPREPQPAKDVRLAPVRGGRVTEVRHGPDGAHARRPGARDLREED
jgi:integrase